MRLGKIAISSENLKANMSEADEESRQQLQIITNASEHMMAMVTRIHSQMKDIILQEKPCRLDEVIEECLRQHRHVLENQGAVVLQNYTCRPTLLCDAVHVREGAGQSADECAGGDVWRRDHSTFA